MTLKFIEEKMGVKIYTSDVITDKLFMYSKHCTACGAEVDIFNNTEICWMSPDRKHHPSFVMADISTGKESETK